MMFLDLAKLDARHFETMRKRPTGELAKRSFERIPVDRRRKSREADGQ